VSQYDDSISRLLDEHGITEDRVEQVRTALGNWLRRQPPQQRLYALPDQTQPELLTAQAMARELEQRTSLGMSYVEVFIAGGLSNPHYRLDDVLARLAGHGSRPAH